MDWEFVVRHLMGRKQTAGHIITSSFSPRFSFIPFVDMIRGPVETALNILLFMPLGFFLPVLYEKYDTLGKIALVGFLYNIIEFGAV